jgi:RHS repeat-associated protein
MPNMRAITNGFDGLARLTNTTLRQSGGTVLDRYGYAHNLASQRTQMTRTDGSYVDYTYDPFGEVIKALGSGGESTENLGYKYDPAWNLNTRTNAGYTTAFNVDVLNQLTTVSNLSCTYDANGNLTARVYDANGPKTYAYGYDDENQLTSAATDTYYTGSGSRWKSEYTYDGRQRLRKRVDYTWNTQYSQWQVSAETRYIYAGNLVIQERNSSNTPTVSYVRGTDLSGSRQGAGGIGGLLARSDQYSAGMWGRHVFYHADGNGNITYLVDASQNLAAKYRYDPFGGTTYSSGTLAGANVYRFSSKAAQPNSGLYYYGYRFYEPYLQRWLNRDPLGEWGGLNLYEFGRNGPVMYVDPVGFKISFWDVVPIVGTYRSCMQQPSAYTVRLDLCECRSDPASAELACQQDIDRQAMLETTWALEDGILQTGVDVITAGVGLAIALVNPVVGFALDSVLAVDAVANGACDIWFGFKVKAAAEQAKNGCKCPRE